MADLRDVDGLVADAFEIVVDTGNGEHEAQIGSHQLVQSEELNDAIVDFELQFIDGVFFTKTRLARCSSASSTAWMA